MQKISNKGFTLIEILVVIGIIALLATIVIIAINPARQFAQARDTQRTSHVTSLLDAIGHRIADHKGLFRDPSETTCTTAMDPTLLTAYSTSTIQQSGAGSIDLRPCLVPTYITELPIDPSVGTTWDGTTYNTKYGVSRDSSGRIHVVATTTEPNIPRLTVIEIAR